MNTMPKVKMLTEEEYKEAVEKVIKKMAMEDANSEQDIMLILAGAIGASRFSALLRRELFYDHEDEEAENE